MISYPKPRISILEMWPSPTLNIKAVLEKDNVLGFGISLNDLQLYPPSWSYTDHGSYAEMAAGALEYFIAQVWPKRGRDVKPRVALITREKAFGRVSSQLIKKHAIATGKYEVIVEQFFADMPRDWEVSEFLSDFEKRGVDIIWSNSTIQTSATIMKTLHKLGLSNKMFLLGNPSAPPDLLLEIVGPSIAEGYISPQSVFIPATEPDEPGVKFAKMLNGKYRKESELPNIHYMNGIRMKAMMLESVRGALIGMMKRDNIDLTKACKWINGKEIKELGTQTLAGYSAYETTIKLQSAPSGKDDRRLTDHHRLIGVKDGKVTVLSPWYKVPRLIPD
jgi:Txe/YoeB family toxin of Txe-Axe toxin-antitoxin module